MPELNVSRAFQLFLAFKGDVEKTAVALECPAKDVKALARKEDWDSALAQLGASPEGPDSQVLINRTINFVQAHRMRAVVDDVVEFVRAELSTPAGRERLLFANHKESSVFTTRAITDLVKAMEACHKATQEALGDTGGSQTKEPDQKGKPNVFLSVMKAMDAADGAGANSTEIVRRQLGAGSKPLQK